MTVVTECFAIIDAPCLGGPSPVRLVQPERRILAVKIAKHLVEPQVALLQLGRLLEEPAFRDNLSTKAMAWVQSYSWANVANQYESVFAALINDHRSAGSTHD